MQEHIRDWLFDPAVGKEITAGLTLLATFLVGGFKPRTIARRVTDATTPRTFPRAATIIADHSQTVTSGSGVAATFIAPTKHPASESLSCSSAALLLPRIARRRALSHA